MTSTAPRRQEAGAAPATYDVSIGHVVWHGAPPVSARALHEAIREALQAALQQGAVVPLPSRAERIEATVARAVARQLLPHLPLTTKGDH